MGSEGQNFDAIVVGAGLGGLCVGALLTKKERQRVLVLERQPSTGGRAYHYKGSELKSVEDYLGPLRVAGGWLSRSMPDLQTMIDEKILHGYSFELGMHDIVNGEVSRMVYLLNSIDVPVEIVPLKAFGYWSDGQLHDVQRGKLPFLDSDEYKEMRGILSEMVNMTIDEVRSYHEESLWDYLQKRTSNAKVIEFFDILGGLTVGMNSSRDLSAGDFILDTRMPIAAGLHFADGTLGQMAGESFMQIAHDLTDVIRNGGGEVRLGQDVQEVIVENGTVVGVRLPGADGPQELRAPAVVVNVPGAQALKGGLLPRAELPADFIAKIEAQKSSGAVTPIFGLKRSVTDIPGFIMTRVPVDDPALPDGIVMAYEAHSLFVEDKAPEGKEIIEIWTGYSTEEMISFKENGKLDVINDAILNWFHTNVPGFTDALEWALFPAFNYVVSVAPMPGQAWDGMLDPQGPLAGLFFVGDSCKNYGSFMDGVAYTALRCLDAMTGKDYTEQTLPLYQREI